VAHCIGMPMDFQLYLEQLRRDASPRPHYGFIVLNAAVLAKALGKSAVTVIEFGVAQGAGLTVMENHAMIIETCTGVRIDVVGFDNGTGLPEHRLDYRDAPHVWQPGMFRMNEAELRAKLTRATLVLGDVAGTVAEFCRRSDLAPVGAISFDLDYYSSTKSAFGIFDLPAHARLPRIFCYFDDLFGNSPFQAFNEHIGQQLAIREYNAAHEGCKLTSLPQLMFMRRIPSLWNQRIVVHHDFEHSDYTTYIPQDAYKPLF
jgi:hypothetical protein